MTFDIGPILDTHELQGVVPKAVVDIARAVDADLGAIDTQGYQPWRANELKVERQQRAVAAFVDQIAALSDAAAQADAATLDQHARDEHARVSKANGHAVDPARITAATTPAEIVVLLRDAEAMDVDTLQRTWSFAEPTLVRMANKEMRQHRLPSTGSAFNTLVLWRMRMTERSKRVPDRQQLSETAARRQREIRQQVLAVARVVGLDVAVEAALRKAKVAVADEPQPAAKTVVGKFWQMHPHLRGR